MKKCPYCAEEIQEEAIKCKHCLEFLNGGGPPPVPAPPLRWFFRTWMLVFALGSVGPLALPLIWWHPRLNLAWKIVISLGTLALTWLLYQSMVESIKMLNEMTNTLKGM